MRLLAAFRVRINPAKERQEARKKRFLKLTLTRNLRAVLQVATVRRRLERGRVLDVLQEMAKRGASRKRAREAGVRDRNQTRERRKAYGLSVRSIQKGKDWTYGGLSERLELLFANVHDQWCTADKANPEHIVGSIGALTWEDRKVWNLAFKAVKKMRTHPGLDELRRAYPIGMELCGQFGNSGESDGEYRGGAYMPRYTGPPEQGGTQVWTQPAAGRRVPAPGWNIRDALAARGYGNPSQYSSDEYDSDYDL